MWIKKASILKPFFMIYTFMKIFCENEGVDLWLVMFWQNRNQPNLGCVYLTQYVYCLND